jgi:hypothetical protein
MSHARRAFAGAVCAVAIVALLSGSLSSSASAADASSSTVAAAAPAWLRTQQQSDGGLWVIDPSFETRDSALALAAAAQTTSTWSTVEARAALSDLHFGGNGPTPLDQLDAFAENLKSAPDAGAAAKTIVLSALPLGFDPAAFDPAGNGNAVDLVAMLDSGCSANSASFGSVFWDTLYGMLAKKLVCGAVPSSAIATVRDAQQVNGGWNFNGDPTASDVDPDSTALAIEALIASGSDHTDPSVAKALQFFAAQQQASGAWQAFGGSDDTNSTSLVVMAIAAAGFDPTVSCWRDTADSGLAGAAYASPDAWLRAQQQSDGHIASEYYIYGVNTSATAQAVEGLTRSWLPVAKAAAVDCVAAPTPPTAVPSPVDPVVAQVVTVRPSFTG